MAYQCFNYKCLPPFSLSQVIYQPFPIHSHSCYHINKDTLQKASDTAEHLLLSPLVLRGKVRRQTAHFHKQSVHLQHFPCSVVLSCLCLYPIGNNKSSPSFLRSKSFAFLYIYSVSISVKKKRANRTNSHPNYFIFQISSRFLFNNVFEGEKSSMFGKQNDSSLSGMQDRGLRTVS